MDIIVKATKDRDPEAIDKIRDELVENLGLIFENAVKDAGIDLKETQAEKVDLKNYVKEINQKDIKISFEGHNGIFGFEIDLSAEGIKESDQPETKLMLDRKGDIDVIVCFNNEKCYKVHTIYFHEWEFKK
jgi:predicted HTH domain antitoxin